MEILTSIAVGAVIGWLASVWQRCSQGAASGVAIGILGALLGATTEAWIGSVGQRTMADGVLAAAIGSGLLLVLWIVARRLFLTPPTKPVHRA